MSTTVALPAVASDRTELAAALAAARRGGRRLALVPTMGALHDGHRALIRLAREHADAVVLSIFVNPLQFGETEDLDRYPRQFDADLQACRDEGVSVVFAPRRDVMYPEQPVVRVTPGPMGEVFEGASRPGHFEGVLTVVCKLLGLARPEVAVFGQKDAQQLALVRRMVRDLDLPTEIVGSPTVREPDGLATSTRNDYLSDEGRTSALGLSRALRAASLAAPAGPAATLRAGEEVVARYPGIELDYLALVDPETFSEVEDDFVGEALLLLAGTVEGTRLIDNERIDLSAR